MNDSSKHPQQLAYRSTPNVGNEKHSLVSIVLSVLVILIGLLVITVCTITVARQVLNMIPR